MTAIGSFSALLASAFSKTAMAARSKFSRVRTYLPPLNFITLHYLYFIGTTLLTSVIFYCISTPAWSIPYTDCLFLQISAMTEAGLNTYNLSMMNTVQQIMLMFQIVIGSAVFVSISTLHVRRKAFEKRFGTVRALRLKESKEKRSEGMEVSNNVPNRTQVLENLRQDRDENENEVAVEDGTEVGTDVATETTSNVAAVKGQDHISFVTPDRRFDASGGPSKHKRRHSQLFSFTGVGASPVTTSAFRRPGQNSLVSRTNEMIDVDRERSTAREPGIGRGDFLHLRAVGRNSQFHGLTSEEREQLGGVEYRAITLLSWIVPIYFVLWQFLGALSVGAWMAMHARDVTEANGINPWWNGAFNAISAFNNSGMSLLDANMMPFQRATYPVISMGLLILAGNTAYPAFLRFILWTMLKLLPVKARYHDLRETLAFVLNHPRRVYTNLFPSRPTWWLLMTLIILNGTDWIFFELLNIGNAIVESIPTGSRILDGLFQALAVRSGGFYIVPIAQIRIGVQALYVVMMYISVYPVAITTRSSNVYEERSLGIYAEEPSQDDEEKNVRPDTALTNVSGGRLHRLRRSMTGQLIKPSETRSYFIRQQMRGQLEHDLSWLVVAVLIITCIETSSFERDPQVYSVFNIVFEVVSGYGCVGISTGLSDQAYSFSGGWHVVSKLVLCAIMLRGRHRGLPVALDRAVLLPHESERAGRREEEDHILRHGRTISRPAEARNAVGDGTEGVRVKSG